MGVWLYGFGVLLIYALLRELWALLEQTLIAALQCPSDMLFFASLTAISLLMLGLASLLAENVPLPAACRVIRLTVP